jgi:hypothetical protein
MRTLEVVDHWREAQEAELATMVEAEQELYEQIPDLRDTGRTLHKIINGRQDSFDFSGGQPRPSHILLSKAYSDTYNAYRGSIAYTNTGDQAKVQLSNFIGNFILPMSGVSSTTHPIQGTLAGKDVAMCWDAEEYFNDCLTQINTGRYRLQTRISVYHDRQGTPLALRKHEATSSAITLVPVSIEGILVPPGSITGVGAHMNKVMTGVVQRDDAPTYATYLVNNPFAIRPQRLSPWAYDDPLDRSLYALEDGPKNGDPEYKRARGRFIEGRTLDDFRQAADKVMSMCGTNP